MTRILVLTEPHSVHRIPLALDPMVPKVDVSALHVACGLHSSPSRRRAAFRAVEMRLLACATSLRGAHEILLDVSEGWFGAGVFHLLREIAPSCRIVGMQHGMTELTGPLQQILVRRVRARLARLQWRVLRSIVWGAGFGNLPFSRWMVYGEKYRSYILRLQPEADIVCNMAALTPLPVEWTAAESERVLRVLYLDQDVERWHASAERKTVLRELARLRDSSGALIMICPHPKLASTPEMLTLCATLGLPLHLGSHWTTACGTPGTAIVSFFSTGLIEAAASGYPVLSVHSRRLPTHFYEPFKGTVEAEDLHDAIVSGRYSSVDRAEFT